MGDVLLQYSILVKSGELTDAIIAKLKTAEISQAFDFLLQNVTDSGRVSLFKEAFSQNHKNHSDWKKRINLSVAEELSKNLSIVKDPIRMENVIEEKGKKNLLEDVKTGFIIYDSTVTDLLEALDDNQDKVDIKEIKHLRLMNKIFQLHNTLAVSDHRIKKLDIGVNTLQNGVQDLLVN